MLCKLWRKWREPKAFHQGYLPEKDGHSIFFQEFGNPQGDVVLLTHGGPGGRTHSGQAAGLDLKKYRVIMFDQRGCGKSLPLGRLEHNSMADTLDDMKRLYDYLSLQGKVILRGASWGATVMLCFAEKYPELVKMMLLSQIFLADDVSTEWVDRQSALFYPEFMEQMTPRNSVGKSLPEYYAGLINSNNLKQQLLAANTYGWYERVLGAFQPSFGKKEELDEAELAELRIYMNYAAQDYTLKPSQIMKNVKKIADIPMLLVHNRLDMVCPLFSVYELHKKMPASKLVITPGIGHYNLKLKRAIRQEIMDYLNKQNNN